MDATALTSPGKPLPPLEAGTLYLVATPIGNLEDITLRALRTLRECDVIAAEDTRHTAQLLHHYGIQKPLLSYFRFNEARRSSEILQRLASGERVALVTDAGTPGISDPGQRVARAALEAGHAVESVPGPCAFVAALAASGLPTDEFHFAGFLPHKSGQRRRELERLRDVPGTLVLYESPYRIERLLGELVEVMPAREVVLARELTKRFEEFRRGTPAALQAASVGKTWKGEFTVLIGPADLPATRVGAGIAADADADADAGEEDVEGEGHPEADEATERRDTEVEGDSKPRGGAGPTETTDEPRP
ncbi:MAG: 16S rRNA (cytidine(1402)-2'-O)-methyltransferase [Verrucomicrobiales bacterium]|nr:16S rRNA (cytidine(1402)-2'-O)-methyltransferase [Verrucomicrobiales bacterium]